MARRTSVEVTKGSKSGGTIFTSSSQIGTTVQIYSPGSVEFFDSTEDGTNAKRTNKYDGCLKSQDMFHSHPGLSVCEGVC